MTPPSSSSKTKRALVTGASEGIGRAFALKLAKRGYTVTAVARNASRLDSLLAELGGSGHRKIVADLSTETGLNSVVDDLTNSERYTLLVNNAGFGLVGDFAETPLAKTREMIFLNVTALVDLSHAFLGRAERGDGIIQVASVLGFLPMPRQAIYSATKAFVASFAESLWFQCRKKGIMIVNLCPGSTATNFPDRAGWSKNEIPAWATESADTVAENALVAFERKFGPTLVSGWMNRLSLLLVRLLTRKQLVKVMGTVRK
ncbi:MAG: SDR family NAD(P)-dependent oxidoreductase [Bdellovibrionales bacterium]|nr:SDR family NAD(P)-dependent oxidoreductase [Bdellovibrionales bacterium]